MRGASRGRTRRTATATWLCLGLLSGAAGAARAEPAAEPLPLLVAPAEIDLGRVDELTRGAFRLTLANRTAAPIRLNYIYAECDCSFEMPAGAEVPARGETRLEVHYDMKGTAPGRWNETITILTDHERQPEIVVPVTAWVEGRREQAGNRPAGG